MIPGKSQLVLVRAGEDVLQDGVVLADVLLHLRHLGEGESVVVVFVVLEGEVNVVIHNTQFTAKKGDSFYIPPKNYYNIINDDKAR